MDFFDFFFKIDADTLLLKHIHIVIFNVGLS